MRQYRKKSGFKTLEQLALASGIPRSTLGNIETGKRNPSEDLLQTICKALKISTEEFRGAAPSFDVEKAQEVPRRAYDEPRSTSDRNPEWWPLSGQTKVALVVLATKLRTDARDLHAIATRMELEAKAIEDQINAEEH